MSWVGEHSKYYEINLDYLMYNNILLPGALLFIYYFLIWVQYMRIHNLKNKIILLSIPESCTTPAAESIYFLPYLPFDFKGTL